MDFAVVMAGGIGSRFWPRSRQANPKQFLNVFGDASLLQNTLGRLQGLLPPERCYVVTHERYAGQSKEQLPAIPPGNVLGEPISRNTAPCIAYAAVELHAIDPQGVMAVMPADHVIQNVAHFHQVLRVASRKARERGALVTIGIEPTHPETGYGYIQYEPPSTPSPDEPQPYRVRTFAEKPDLATAERFIDSGDFLWNSGMFIWRVDSILDAFRRHLPEVYEAFEPALAATGPEERRRAVVEAYQKSPKISIDYGVMERAEQVYVVPGSFGWSDVGDWRAVYEMSEKDRHGNAIQGNVILHDASRTLVHAGQRLVILIGVHDTIVVDTDDALLVCHRDSAQQVKNVVDYLHAHQLNEYV